MSAPMSRNILNAPAAFMAEKETFAGSAGQILIGLAVVLALIGLVYFGIRWLRPGRRAPVPPPQARQPDPEGWTAPPERETHEGRGRFGGEDGDDGDGYGGPERPGRR